MTRDSVGGVLIGCMAATTLLGSITGLVHYASGGDPGVITVGTYNIPLGTIAFVAGLDGLAIALTFLAHRKGSTDWAAFAGLVVATAASTGLQVAAVWGNAQNVIVHGSPPVCTAVAAFYWLNSLGHKETLPPPPVHVSGGTNDGASASGPDQEAAAAPPPAPEVSPAQTGLQQRRPSTAKRGTGRAGGRPKLQGEDLYRATAIWLNENERLLGKRTVQEAVRAVRGSCAAALRDEVYEALSEPDALTFWAETSATGDAKESD